jgi:hypothetical protein
MVKDINSEVRNAYNLEEWSTEALERLRRFVQILSEWDTKDSDRRDGVDLRGDHDSEDSSTPPPPTAFDVLSFDRVVSSTELVTTVTKRRRWINDSEQRCIDKHS